MTLLQRLAEPRPLVLDGPTGTELRRRGVDTTLPLWSARALMVAPKIVQAIHAEYLTAGADLITTNTFRTNPRTLDRAGLSASFPKLVKTACGLARDAVDEVTPRRANGPWVLASLAPVEDCYRPDLVPSDDDLEREHEVHARELARHGIDGFLVETMNTVREADIATRAAQATGLPVFTSFVCGADARLLSDEPLAAAVTAAEAAGASAVLVNCQDLDRTTVALEALGRYSKTPFGGFANLGVEDPGGGWTAGTRASPNQYAHFAGTWIQGGARIVGSCCGTGPDHIRAIAHKLRPGARPPFAARPAAARPRQM